MEEYESNDDNNGNEFRRESVCIVREYRLSRRNQSIFMDTIKHERSAEDYQQVQSIKFNVTVFPLLNDNSKSTFNEIDSSMLENFKLSEIITAYQREFGRVYKNIYVGEKRNLHWMTGYGRVTMKFNPGIRIQDRVERLL